MARKKIFTVVSNLKNRQLTPLGRQDARVLELIGRKDMGTVGPDGVWRPDTEKMAKAAGMPKAAVRTIFTRLRQKEFDIPFATTGSRVTVNRTNSRGETVAIGIRTAQLLDYSVKQGGFDARLISEKFGITEHVAKDNYRKLRAAGFRVAEIKHPKSQEPGPVKSRQSRRTEEIEYDDYDFDSRKRRQPAPEGPTPAQRVRKMIDDKGFPKQNINIPREDSRRLHSLLDALKSGARKWDELPEKTKDELRDYGLASQFEPKIVANRAVFVEDISKHPGRPRTGARGGEYNPEIPIVRVVPRKTAPKPGPKPTFHEEALLKTLWEADGNPDRITPAMLFKRDSRMSLKLIEEAAISLMEKGEISYSVGAAILRKFGRKVPKA